MNKELEATLPTCPKKLIAGSIVVRGPKGDKGDPGISPYELAVEKGFRGTEQEWLDSLVGPIGPQGIQGIQGPQGIQGIQGEKGDTGEQGPVGPQGIQGERGPQGIQGEQGPQGIQGEKGDIGPQGVQGERGPQGIKGDTGDVGPQGEKGAQGEKGDIGPQGIKGDKGDTGEQGPVGPQGEVGPRGPQGPQGIQGEKGDPGPEGPQGPKGDTGETIEFEEGNTVEIPTIEDLATKLTEPTGAKVGQFFRVASIDADGHYVLEAVDAPNPDLTDYVKNTDYATSQKSGIISLAYNMVSLGGGQVGAGINDIDTYNRIDPYNFISKGTLNNVLAAPSIMPALTPEEQLAARQRLGIVPMSILTEVDIAPQTYVAVIDLPKKCTVVDFYVTFDGERSASVNVYFGVKNKTGQGNAHDFCSMGYTFQASDTAVWSRLWANGTPRTSSIFGRNGNTVAYSRQQKDYPTEINDIDGVIVHFYDHTKMTSNAHVVICGY